MFTRPGAWSVGRGIKNTWNDTYTARRRVFPDGQCEVTVVKERFFIGPALRRKPREKRGESSQRKANDDDAGRRAKKNVRLCCKQIGADRMVTLTYRENMLDRELALKHWKAFCRKLGKHRQFHYVAVIEEQARGALHFHVAVAGRQMYALLRSIWQGILGRGPNGDKEMQCRALDQKRYFRSRGIVVPEVDVWRVPFCTNMLRAAQVAFQALSGHCMDGLQTWCNNNLGVVHLATAPGLPQVVDDCPF